MRRLSPVKHPVAPEGDGAAIGAEVDGDVIRTRTGESPHPNGREREDHAALGVPDDEVRAVGANAPVGAVRVLQHPEVLGAPEITQQLVRA